MTYRVIKYFTDLQDNDRPYNVGDIFPYEGKEVAPSRLAELSSSNNRRGIPLIELVKDSKAKAKDVKPVEAEAETVEANEPIEAEAEVKAPAKKGRPKKNKE